MATALAQRLRRLEAIRQVAEQLLNRPQLGREVFPRGQPEPIAEIKRPEWSATLYDLLSAYAGRRQKQARAYVRVPKRTVWSLAEAREALERLIGQSMDWSAARRISARLHGRAVARCDGSGLELRRGARIGARRPSRNASAGGLCSALCPQAAGCRVKASVVVVGTGEWIRGRPGQWRMWRRCG